jgi:hypothetical protein
VSVQVFPLSFEGKGRAPCDWTLKFSLLKVQDDDQAVQENVSAQAFISPLKKKLLMADSPRKEQWRACLQTALMRTKILLGKLSRKHGGISKPFMIFHKDCFLHSPLKNYIQQQK